MLNYIKNLNLLQSLILSAIIALPTLALSQLESGTTFTHQGSLRDAGQPANGNYDFQFALYDAATNGVQVNSTQTVTNVAVVEGVYSATLDFGGAFTGNALWLEIRVRQVGAPSYTTLSPRRSISPVPYALYAEKANTATTSTTLDSAKIDANTVSNSYGEATISGPNSSNVYLGARTEDRDLGLVRLSNEDSDSRLEALVSIYDFGILQTYGSNGSLNVLLSSVGGTSSTNASNGYIAVYNAQTNEDIVAEMLSIPNEGGRVAIFNQDGDKRNIVMEPYSQDTDHGYMGVYDRNDDVQVEIFVDTSRRGVVISDLNLSPISPNGKSVTYGYSTLLGAEVGLYTRGTAELVNGTATVTLPSNFAEVATPGTITAQLTPGSSASLGLAVESITPGQLVIRELQNGTGNYTVHYLVFGERNDVEADKDGNKLPAYLFNKSTEKPVHLKPILEKPE